MGTLANLIANTKAAMAARIGAVLVLRKTGEAETSDEIVTAIEGASASGALAVEGVAGGTAIPVSGTVTATVDVSTLATHVKQDTGNASLASILAKQTTLNGYVSSGTWTPATQVAPADSGIISADACTVRSILISNRTASAIYVMFFDDPNGVADGTFPRIPMICVPAQTTVEVALGGLVCANGLCWACSSTFGSLTITAATPAIVSAELV
jgi:hypothetical protein